MKVTVAYVFPTVQPEKFNPAAARFASTWSRFGPGEWRCDLKVVCNGPEASPAQKQLFEGLPASFATHNNQGKDIGAFLATARAEDADVLVCFGSHIHFKRSGWLDRMMSVYVEKGPGLYGCWGFAYPDWHIRTTAFWLPPDLLRQYPRPVVTDPERYEFERGRQSSLLRWADGAGFPVTTVEWHRTRTLPQFDHVESEDCLLLDQHTDRLGYQ